MKDTLNNPICTGMRHALTALACGAALVLLSGCVELAVGSAVVGTLAASDRRTFGAQTEDKAIVLKGEARLSRRFGEAAHINVTAFNRRALLTGEVADEATRQAAEQEVRSIEGVVGVVNEVQIAGTSNFSSRSSDALITTKVKASLVETRDLYANAFKVVTEAGVVYLMGRVTEREARLAAEVTRGVSGVRKVVKVFDYISESELKAMQAAPDKQE